MRLPKTIKRVATDPRTGDRFLPMVQDSQTGVSLWTQTKEVYDDRTKALEEKRRKDEELALFRSGIS